MNIPSAEIAVGWAKTEALQLVDRPTQTRKYLLRLLHIIKSQEQRIHALEEQCQTGQNTQTSCRAHSAERQS